MKELGKLPEIRVGDIFINPRALKVRVKNPDGNLNDSNTRHSFNQTAYIREGGKLTVVAIDGDQILVSHRKLNKEKSFGTEAGNGVLFLVSRWKFMKLIVPGLKDTAGEWELRYIKQLLEKAKTKPS
jgi:hypothetical protein